jgi:hypothetical protein
MKHIQNFDNFINENLNEASLTGGKPQWRVGEYGDLRYSATIQYAGGKVPVMAVPSKISTGRYDAVTSDIAESGWGDKYTIVSQGSGPYFNANEMGDFLAGLKLFVDAVMQNANNDLVKSKLGKDMQISNIPSAKTRTVNVSFVGSARNYRSTANIFKQASLKQYFAQKSRAQLESDIKREVETLFNKVYNLVVSENQLSFSIVG